MHVMIPGHVTVVALTKGVVNLKIPYIYIYIYITEDIHTISTLKLGGFTSAKIVEQRAITCNHPFH